MSEPVQARTDLGKDRVRLGLSDRPGLYRLVKDAFGRILHRRLDGAVAHLLLRFEIAQRLSGTESALQIGGAQVQGRCRRVQFSGLEILHQLHIGFEGTAAAKPLNRPKTLTGIDAGLHRVGLRLRYLAVCQHLVDGLQLRLLEGILCLGRRQVQDPGQLVNKDLSVVLRAVRRGRRRWRRLNRGHADDHRRQASRRHDDPTIQLHSVTFLPKGFTTLPSCPIWMRRA